MKCTAFSPSSGLCCQGLSPEPGQSAADAGAALLRGVPWGTGCTHCSPENVLGGDRGNQSSSKRSSRGKRAHSYSWDLGEATQGPTSAPQRGRARTRSRPRSPGHTAEGRRCLLWPDGPRPCPRGLAVPSDARFPAGAPDTLRVLVSVRFGLGRPGPAAMTGGGGGPAGRARRAA